MNMVDGKNLRIIRSIELQGAEARKPTPEGAPPAEKNRLNNNLNCANPIVASPMRLQMEES